MHDIRAIRADPAGFDAALARRGLPPVVGGDPGDGRRTARGADRAAGEAGTAQRAGARDRPGQAQRRRHRPRWKPRRRRCAARWKALEKRAAALDDAIRGILEGLPNMLDPDVPDGPDESANVVLKQHGEPRDLGFQPKQHFELGEALGMMDFATAAKLAGSALHRAARPAGPAGARARPVHARPAHARARLHRDGRAVAGQRRHRLWHRQSAEIRRRPVPAPRTAAG